MTAVVPWAIFAESTTLRTGVKRDGRRVSRGWRVHGIECSAYEPVGRLPDGKPCQDPDVCLSDVRHDHEDSRDDMELPCPCKPTT